MATLFLETPQATHSTQFWGTIGGSVTRDATAARDPVGLSSWKCASGAGNAAAYLLTASLTSRRASAYFYFEHFPASDVSILWLNGGMSLKITSGGVLKETTSGDTGSTLATGTLYRISITQDGINFRVYVNGVIDITTANADPSGLDARFGWLSAPGANRILNVSHCYVDDDASGDDPGGGNALRVTAKLPDELNDDNYDSTEGTGAVNERPINEANCKHHDARSQVLQDWTLETAAEGDVDISGDTLVARCAWMWAMSSKDGDTVCIVDNGDSATCWPDIDGVVQLCTKITDSAVYPSNAAGIGQKSGPAAPDEYLYECGTLIAYIVSIIPAAIAPPLGGQVI